MKFSFPQYLLDRNRRFGLKNPKIFPFTTQRT
nr:MAG TPA: hypothetical protein [Caudoviricetes sp.]